VKSAGLPHLPGTKLEQPSLLLAKRWLEQFVPGEGNR
jgi:hypothetical protein